MRYNSIAEIYEALDASHARFNESIGQLSESEQGLQAAPESWTIAQIVEHVAIVESSITKLAGVLLHKAASAATTPAPEGGRPFAPVSIEEHVARSLREKYQAPETALPRGEAIADSLAKLNGAYETLRELRPRIEETDGTSVSYPHPAFGPLNLYEWLVMVGVHLDRHLRQIEAIKETSYAEK